MSERQRRMIDEAEKSCARLVAIVAELSDIGKLDSGAVKFAQQPLDLFSLVGKVAELVHEASERDVHLKLIGPSDGAHDDRRRRRACSTAFDAIFRAILREKPGRAPWSPSAGCETARRRPARRRDRRPTKAAYKTAYDREPGPFDDKRGGLGLALPLARRVIEGHGGRIWSPAAATAASDSCRSARARLGRHLVPPAELKR